jgi:hypothetical protein
MVDRQDSTSSDLRPGGRLLLTLNNDANPFVWVRNRLPQHLLKSAGIIPCEMKPAARISWLREVLQGPGFRIDQSCFWLHCLRFLAVRSSRLVDRFCGVDGRLRFFEILRSFEKLERAPTRTLTGSYIVVFASK